MNIGTIFADRPPDDITFTDYVLSHLTQEMDEPEFTTNMAVGLLRRLPWSRVDLEKPVIGFIHAFKTEDGSQEMSREQFLTHASEFAARSFALEFALVSTTWGVRGEADGSEIWKSLNVPQSTPGAVKILSVHFLTTVDSRSEPTMAWVTKMDKPHGPWEGYHLTDEGPPTGEPKE